MDIKEDIDTDEINLLDYLIVVAKRKRLILIITLSAAIITAIYGLILPPIYRAETNILISQQGGSSLAMGLPGQLGGSEIVGAALGIKTPSDLYVGMLKSRTIADRIIDRFGLMKLYGVEYREDAVRKVFNVMKATVDRKTGIITVSVEDKDPERAAKMANAFVEELKNLTNGLVITEAAQRRLFFEEQLKGTKMALTKAEEDLRGFEERSGAVHVEDQAKAVIESIANIRAQIAAKEVQLRVMKTYATAQNQDLQKLEEELKGLNEQLSRLEAKGGRNPDSLIPTGRMPEIGTEYIRRLRDLKFNETLYELLIKQYETARLDEAREAVVIQAIDKALPPEKKAKPKRIQMVMLATFVGFFFSIFAAFFMEYKERASSDPKNKERLETLKRYANFRLKK